MKRHINFAIIFISIIANLSFSQTNTEKEYKSFSRSDDDLNAEQVIDKYKPALISIWYSEKDFYSYNTYSYVDTMVLNGSGFIFNEVGLIGTNYHVVENIDSLIVKTSDGVFYNSELLLIDKENDFAILKIINPDSIKFPVIDLGNSDNVKAGQEVYAIGSPLGFEYTISSGIVAAVRENENVSFSDPVTYEKIEKEFEKVLQITAAISPGNSGGALFNSRGEVIGITTYTYIGYGNLNFAVAINSFKKLIKLEETKEYLTDNNLKVTKEESQFATNYKQATEIKSQLLYDWSYSRQKDSMKTPDIFTIEQDSINRSKFVKAEINYLKCMELKPDTFLVYQDLLDMYVITDHFQKAEELYRDIIIKFNSDSLLNFLSSNLATAYSSSKNYDKALQFYNKMLEEDNSQYFIYFQIANMYEEMKDYKKAISEYKKLLVFDPDYNEANIRLGKIYYTKYSNLTKANMYLQKAYENELLNTGATPYNFDLLYYIGMIAVDEERKLDAIMAYMDLKAIYTYDEESSLKKVKLYKKILSLEE